jgi:NADH pyrophosphatase NudC (nudix superfamily)
MDPQETLRRLIESMETDEPGDTAEHARALLEWYDRGGFCPTVGWEQLAPLVGAVLAFCEHLEPRNQDPRQ